MTAIAAPAVTMPSSVHSPWRTLRRGLALSPELRRGLPLTLLLALVSTGGRVVVPVVVQRTLDRGILAPGGIDVAVVAQSVALAALALVCTGAAGGLMQARLTRSTETALSNLRVRTFRHVHDLPQLLQAEQQRGVLVSRVTADVDVISQFLQWGGVVLLASTGQLLLATVAMALYSVPLTLAVVATFVPLWLLLRRLQRRLTQAYAEVRTRLGTMLGTIAEAVVGAPVIRAYGTEARTAARIDRAVDRHFAAAFRAVKLAAGMYAGGELAAAAASAVAVVFGIILGVGVLGSGGGLTAGGLIAFLFLVSLFVAPIQIATEVLDQAQSAVAGWGRVLDVLDTPAEVSDPPDGLALPSGPLGVCFEGVTYTYPGATEPALRAIDLEVVPGARVAVVGETGSGKSTLAKLLVRLMDPTAGVITIGGVPLPRARAADLRRRVVLVPQDGFLFAGDIAANVRRGCDGATEQDLLAAFAQLDLADWLATLPQGLATPVGERGEELSVGERQLVALARAAVAQPDLLVLDEATSAVDPATEARIAHALEILLEDRTAVIVAHRLSTAEAADDVVVIDAGRIAERGHHTDLLARGGVYALLHREWRRQHDVERFPHADGVVRSAHADGAEVD